MSLNPDRCPWPCDCPRWPMHTLSEIELDGAKVKPWTHVATGVECRRLASHSQPIEVPESKRL